MSLPLSLIAGSRWSYDAGVAGAVVVPAGKQVIGVQCLSIAGGTLTVTPGGANQRAVAGPPIPLPAGVALSLGVEDGLTQLGGGTVFAFAGTDTYLITYAEMKAG